MATEAVNSAQVANDQGALNYKIETDASIRSANTAIENQGTNQQGVDAIMREALQTGITLGREVMAGGIDISRAVRAKAIRDIFNVGQEASAFDKTMAAGLETKLANIEGLLSAGQQQAKTAQSTHPESGGQGTDALLRQLANIEAVLRSQEARTTP